MIEKLSKKNLRELDKIACKWIAKIGSGERIDKEKIEDGVTWLYSLINLPKPQFIYVQSPYTMQFAANVLRKQVDTQVRDIVKDQVLDKVFNKVSNQVCSKINSKEQEQIIELVNEEIYTQTKLKGSGEVDNQIYKQIQRNVGTEVNTLVYDKINDKINNQVRHLVRDQVSRHSFKHNWWYQPMSNVGSAWWWGRFAYWEAMLKLGVLLPDNLELMYKKFINLSSAYDFLYYKEYCIVCELPKFVGRDKDGLLHADGGPAILFRDGYSLYSLHGTSVPQVLAETPAEKLTIEFYNNEKSADVRAEFIRKYGLDRMLQFGIEVDSYLNYSDLPQEYVSSQYKLIDMHKIFENITYAPHLLMKNLTVGVYHLEAVSPKCKTIHDAIAERIDDNGVFEIVSIK